VLIIINKIKALKTQKILNKIKGKNAALNFNLSKYRAKQRVIPIAGIRLLYISSCEINELGKNFIGIRSCARIQAAKQIKTILNLEIK